MMGAGVGTGGEEMHGLERARIGGVHHGDAVGEHVADEDVLAAHHHLHAVRPAALVGIGDVLDTMADALGRDLGIGIGGACA
jgi:hypothetical protein